jgi:hypothetical protein
MLAAPTGAHVASTEVPGIAASRETPQGLLRWRISVRDDGVRLSMARCRR